ncbi:MAG: hypothetical protein ACK5TU_05480 [Cyclobacteriaceae bacterium]
MYAAFIDFKAFNPKGFSYAEENQLEPKANIDYSRLLEATLKEALANTKLENNGND